MKTIAVAVVVRGEDNIRAVPPAPDDRSGESEANDPPRAPENADESSVPFWTWFVENPRGSSALV